MGTKNQGLLATLLCVLGLTVALQVTPGSHCAAKCIDSPQGNPFNAADSTTTPDDITCRDADYSITGKGIKFRACLECLQNSSKVDKTESDLRWYAYNLRYTLSTCLYGLPKALLNGTAAAECDEDEACRGLRDPLTASGFDDNSINTWDYCTADNGRFMGPMLSPCLRCLRGAEDEFFLSNFMTALRAGCIQQPMNGNVLNLSGSVFTKGVVTMKSPPAHDSESQSSGSLSASAIAGICIGVFLILFIAVALLILHFRRERVFREWAHGRYYHGHALPETSPDQGTRMSREYRRYYTGNAFGENPTMPEPLSCGECYGRADTGPRAASRYVVNQKSNVIPKPHTLPGNTDANSEEYAVRGISRPPAAKQLNRPRTPSTQSRPNTPDSFAVRVYQGAAEESARFAAQRPPSVPRAPKPRDADTMRHSIKRLIPKFPLPKLAMPFTLLAGRGSSKSSQALHISTPLATHNPRFREIPMTHPQGVPRMRPPHLSRERAEVSLRSVESALYG